MSARISFWQCDDGKRFYVALGEDPRVALDKAVAHGPSDAHEVTGWMRERANMYVGPPVWHRPVLVGRVLVSDESRTLDTSGAGYVMQTDHPDDRAAVWVA